MIGEVYEQLYVQINKNVGYGDSESYGDSSDPGTCFAVYTPGNENPDDPYYVNVYIDWNSVDTYIPISADSVITCSNYEQFEIPSGAVFSFGEIIL